MSFFADLQVLVDFDLDGDFDEDFEDVSAYVRRAKWKLGGRVPGQVVADKGSATLYLGSDDRRFDPEYADSPLFGMIGPQVPVVIKLTYDSTQRTMWTGWVDAVQMPFDVPYPIEVVFQCKDAKEFVEQTEAFVPLQENKRADEIIEAILDATVPETLTYDLDEGGWTFDYAGDTWDQGIDGISAIASAARSERGRFFFARDGKPTFRNREHIQTAASSVTVYEASTADYRYGEDVRNKVQVTYHPRSLSVSTSEILWQNTETIFVPVGQKTITARYSETDSGVVVAGRNAIEPGVFDGADFDGDSDVDLIGFSSDARSADITLENTGWKEENVDTIIVRGQKLTSHNKATVTREDSTSQTSYGKRVLNINAELIDNDDDARQVAAWELLQRKEPYGAFRSFSLKNAAAGDMLAYSMYDKITIHGDLVAKPFSLDEDYLDLDDSLIMDAVDYFIVGEEYDWWEVGLRLNLRLYVERAPRTSVWLLGVAGQSELGETTVLAL